MFETPTPVSAPETPPAPQPFAERLSDQLQHVIQVIVGSQRKPPRRLKSLLNGTWFGHPLHPVMTDVPVAAWILTAIFDIIWLITHTSWAAYGGFVTMIVGLLGALGAIVTGLTDWSDTYALGSITPSSTRSRRSSTLSLFSCGSWPVQVMESLR